MSSDTPTPPPAIAGLASDPAAVPLAYGYLRVAPTPPEVTRTAHSDWHRAQVYGCAGFYKTISRCIGMEV